MVQTSGWDFWIEDNGKVRHFVVGGEDEQKAQAALQTHDPNLTQLNFISRQRLSSEVTDFLGLSPGKVEEWVPGNERDELKARGVDMGRPI